MKTTDEKPKLTELQKIGTLAGALVFVINGLRKSSIESQPITIMEPDAEEYPMISLEQYLWEALGKCGIKERKEEAKTK